MEHQDAIRRYYACYREENKEGLRDLLTPDFRHVSSFAEYDDRDAMLEEIWDEVGESWAREIEIYGDGPEYMVRYEIESESMPAMAMAEYVRFEGDRIAEIEVYVGRELDA